MNHRKLATVCALALVLTTVLSSSAFAAEGPRAKLHPLSQLPHRRHSE